MEDGRAALREACGAVAGIAAGLDERTSWLPTGCAGWAVRDLLVHLLDDARRALTALGTPAAGPADRDAVTYWSDFGGGPVGEADPDPDPGSRRTRGLRTVAATWDLRALAATYAEATSAVVTLAGRADGEDLVATQGHVLCTRDLLATLVVEAALHHLDLVRHLERPGPGAAPLAVVRTTLDGLLGAPAPAHWGDGRWAAVGTGRAPLSDAERADLGERAGRLPLLS